MNDRTQNDMVRKTFSLFTSHLRFENVARPKLSKATYGELDMRSKT